MRDWRKKILIISLFLTLFLPVFVLAAASSDLSQYKPQLSVQIGENTIDFDAVSCAPGEECEIGWISQYVVAVYRYGVGLAAILAAIMIMVGGFLWLTSGGSPDRVGKAKEFITGSLTGLLLALFSYLILYTVNPRLVALEPISITRPAEVEIGDFSPERVAATIAARSGTGGSGSGSDINLWDEQNRPTVTQISQMDSVDRVTTYPGHDDAT